MKLATTSTGALAAFSAVLVARLCLWTYEAAGDRVPTGVDVKTSAQSALLISVDLVLLAVVAVLVRRGGSSRGLFGVLLAVAVVPVFFETAWLHDSLSLVPGDADLAVGSLPLSLDLLLIQVLVAWEFGLLAVIALQAVAVVVDLALVLRAVPLESDLGSQSIEELAFSSIVTIIVCGIIVHLAGRLRSRTARLEQANADLRDYSSKIETAAALEERNRLARELHDTLAHTLSGLTIQLGAIDAVWDQSTVDARRKLHEAEQSARSGLTEARRAMFALTASPLESLGLRAAIEAEMQQLVPANIGLDLQWGNIEALPPSTQQQLYRILQEAIRNAVRHASPSMITVELSVSELDEVATVLVRDDGDGFDPTALAPGRRGLVGMAERVEAIGGSLRIDASQEGTAISATLPLPNQPTR